MAKRPVFFHDTNGVSVKEIEFTWFPGFAPSQKEKSVSDLHKNFLDQFPSKRILEISTKSTKELGRKLSAFNLMVKIGGEEAYFESIFQGSKVFEKGGPYTDLISAKPNIAKKDVRIKDSGKIIGFKFNGETWPCEPKTFFYDWMYIKSVYHQPKLLKNLIEYDAFTDIEFNPKRSLNCQAKAAAMIVFLHKNNILDQVLKNPKELKKFYSCERDPIIKPKKLKEIDSNQLKLF